MRLTIVESPYAGDIEANLEYARRCCFDCIQRNENPFASHLFYTQFLDDANEADRQTGINLGIEWGYIAQYASKAPANPAIVVIAFYVDNGWSPGMEEALRLYTEYGMRCETRRLSDIKSVG